MANNNSLLPPKLLLVDVDGTIVDAAGDLEEGAYDLFELHHMGLQIALCSARPLPSLLKLSSQLTAVDYISACQGTVIASHSDSASKSSNLPEWKIVATNLLSDTDIKNIISISNTYDYEAWFYDTSTWYVSKQTPAVLEEERIARISPHVLHDNNISNVAKALIITSNCSNPQKASNTLTDLLDIGLYAAISKPDYIEIISKTASIYKGAEILAKISKINPAQMVAVGDSMNDRGMLMFAGRRFSFNSSPKLIAETGAEILPPPSNGGLITLAKLLKNDMLG